MLGPAAHMGTSQVSNLLDSVSCFCSLQPLYPPGMGLRTQPLGGLGSLGQGPKGGKVGNNEKVRATSPPNTTLYMASEGCRVPENYFLSPSARPPSCQTPAALGPQLALAHAEPRPGAVSGHSRCPVGSRMWAGGEQAVGRPHHVHPSSCTRSRARPGPSSPARPRHGCSGISTEHTCLPPRLGTPRSESLAIHPGLSFLKPHISLP